MDAAERDDIAALIAERVPAVEIARRLILPLNDVLTVVEELRLAGSPAPNRTAAVHPPARRPAVVTVPPQERPSMSPSAVSSHDAPDPPELAGDLLDLFSRARAIVDKRIAKALDAAEKAHAALVDLVEKYERTGAVRSRIAELEAELAAERDKLKPAKRTAVASPASADAPSASAKEIRAWADRNGIAVPDKGPVPKTVAEQYHAAQQLPA